MWTAPAVRQGCLVLPSFSVKKRQKDFLISGLTSTFSNIPPSEGEKRGLFGPHKSYPDPAKRRPLPDGVAHQQRVDLPPQGGPFRFVTRHRARENPLCVNRRWTALGRLRGGAGPSPTPDLAAPPVPAPGRGAERRPAFLPFREKIFVVTAGSPPGPGGRGLAPVLVTRGFLPAVMCGALCGVWRSPAGAISHCFRYGLLNTNIC